MTPQKPSDQGRRAFSFGLSYNNFMAKFRGKFIVLDGLDGSGKGTQAKLVANYLFDKDKANHIFLTREPYRSRHYQEIRRILKHAKNPKENAQLLAKLFVQDRRAHGRLIRRYLAAGHHVISDRYKYSTLAYQQTQGISLQKLIAMHRGILTPDLILIIDVPADIALRRIAKDAGRSHREVFEQLEFQKQLRKNFLALPKNLPREKIIIIDGNQLPDKVFKDIKKETDKIIRG